MTKKTIFIFFFLCVSLFYNTKRSSRLDWDVFGYYLYLPAKFIYDDIRLEKKDQWLTPLIDKYKTTDNLYQAYKGPKDIYVMKYTMGLAYVYAPFFFVANVSAPILGYEQDGFSAPYQWMLLIGSMLFSLIGIHYLFRILSLYFSDQVVLACVALIIFGSNYFVMTAYDGLMPHNFVFAFFAIMLYQSIKWYEDQKTKRVFIIGLCLGIAALIRPTSIVVAVIPALWSVGDFDSLKKRIALFIKNIPQLLILGGVAILVLLPQFIYWKSVTGEWLFYSYPDEKINLLTPHLVNVFFSYKKGWLLYTPLMIFALIGFVHLYKKYRQLFYPIFIFIIINAYVISCWDCWWYGGSFAQRPFVESYVFMAFPLAAFVEKMLRQKLLIAAPVFLMLAFVLYLNLFQTKQALNGVIHT
ncbi:MAG: glycosyltransferase family 39 protein, partial [Bacteroidetes bacterium]|nr:glycosyltransferase family 39 protein [Bacteroidota bacterium]